MILKECMLIKNDIYVTSIPITNAQPVGIVVHSTGVNNKWLCRYVNPVEGQENYDEIIADIGKNRYGNHWNRSGVGKGVHAMIGLNDAGVVETYQTLPWDICCGGVANGLRVPAGTKYYSTDGCSTCVGTTTTEVMGTGWTSNWAIKLPIDGTTYYAKYASGLSFNYNPNAKIQFEIQEDNLADEDYFNKAFTEAIEFCAYLCKKFNLTVDTITSHKESYQMGYGSGHVDPHNWLGQFGKDMNWFRAEVQKLLDEKPEPEPEVFEYGEKVVIKDDVTTYANGKSIPSWVKNTKPVYVLSDDGEVTSISVNSSMAYTGKIYHKDLYLYTIPISGYTDLSMPILRQNNRDGAVITLKTLLNDLGYRDADGNLLKINNSFDYLVTYVVKNFQEDNKLEVTGVVDGETWKLLLRVSGNPASRFTSNVDLNYGYIITKLCEKFCK